MKIKKPGKTLSIRTFVCSCAAVLFPLLSSVANAAYTCTGPVNGVSISAFDGNVYAANLGGFNWVSLCSVSTVKNNISIDACKSIYTMLITAQVTGRKVTFWFNDEPNTCASHSAWAWLTGWYFGPTLQD